MRCPLCYGDHELWRSGARSFDSIAWGTPAKGALGEIRVLTDGRLELASNDPNIAGDVPQAPALWLALEICRVNGIEVVARAKRGWLARLLGLG